MNDASSWINIDLLEKALHRKYIDALNLYRFVKRETFQRAYTLANDFEKADAKNIIDQVNQVKLTAWTKAVLKSRNELDYLDLEQLKEIAKSIGFDGWFSMNRLQLISAIKSKEKKASNHDDNQRKDSESSQVNGRASSKVRQAE